MKTLRERNIETIKRILTENEDVKRLRGYFEKKFPGEGCPVTDAEKWPFREGRVSLSKLQQKLVEADSASSFTQFLRAGLQQIVNGMYDMTTGMLTYADWVTVVQSNKDTELHAPNHGISFPREVPRQGLYPETGAAGLDIELKNKKHGLIYALEEELLADDQSGTFAQQSGMMGEYMAILSEVLCYGKLASVAGMKYQDYVIPTSETKPSYEASYPWSTAFRGGGANRPAAFGGLNQANIQAGLIGLANQKNLQGIKMHVMPKRLIVGHSYKFDASVLLNSAFYPTTTAAGSTGAFGAINPIQGILDLTVSRFIFKNDGSIDGTSKAWYIVDDTKPWFIHQIRDGVTVVQEATNAGESFNRDIVRFKCRNRMNADFIDPRFAWLGNDGSAS